MEIQKWFNNSIFLARDADWVFIIKNGNSKEEMIKAFEDYLSNFKESKLTDYSLNVYSQSSFIPTNKFTFLGNRIDICEHYKNDPYYPVIEPLYRAHYEYNIDFAQVFINKVNSMGIRPWLTLRMNDSHYLIDGLGLMQSDEFHRALALGKVIGEQYGYFRNNPDFSNKEYTDSLLSYIEEILNKYDIYGLDLDFLREIYCFDYKSNPDCHKIMTEFIRNVKVIITEAEKLHKHKIRLLIRTNRSPKDSMEFGFDIKTMCEEKLIDAISPGPRWECADSAIPIKEWREICGDDIGIIFGLETLNLHSSRTTINQAKAYSAAFYAQGANGIYLSNYFDVNDRNKAIWNFTPENVLSGTRNFTVTYQDISSGSFTPYSPLPFSFDGEYSFDLEVGKIEANNKVKVIINFKGDDLPKLSVNGAKESEAHKIDPIIIYDCLRETNRNLTPDIPVSFETCGIETKSPLTLVFKGSGTIDYIDIIIE